MIRCAILLCYLSDLITIQHIRPPLFRLTVCSFTIDSSFELPCSIAIRRAEFVVWHVHRNRSTSLSVLIRGSPFLFILVKCTVRGTTHCSIEVMFSHPLKALPTIDGLFHWLASINSTTEDNGNRNERNQGHIVRAQRLP